MTYKMISTNAISIFILHHHKNRTCNKNLCLIQEIMRTIKPAFEKYKIFATNFPNLAILTKSAMPGEVQLTFAHVSVGNNPSGDPLWLLPWQDHSTHLLLFWLTSTSTLPPTATRSAFPSLKYSFTPSLETSRGRRSSRTGLRVTPSSTHNL